MNGLTSSNLRIGQVLKIASNATTVEEPMLAQQAPIKSTPKQETPVKTTSKQEAPAANDGSFEHVVTNGETIYSIAKKYNLTTFQLKSFNNLASSEVSVGQKLIIKGAKPAVEETVEAESPNTLKDPSLRYPASRYGLTQIEEKGTAIWIADPDLDPTKMLILHRTAPIGTIIKITNPMSNRSTFAKVIGKFTENESTKDVIIVMTKAVADAIGALDKRFFCNITYGPQENEQ